MKKSFYKDAGVDIEKGNAFIQAIKPMVESTFRPEVLTKIGGFAGCVSLNLERYKRPILVSSTDGVISFRRHRAFFGYEADRADEQVGCRFDPIVVSGAK